MRHALAVAFALLPRVLSADAPVSGAAEVLRAGAVELEQQLRRLDPTLTRIEVAPLNAAPRLATDARLVGVVVPSVDHVSSRVRAELELVQGTAKQRKMPVWYSVRAYKTVPVAEKELQAREQFSPSVVSVREVNVAGLDPADFTADQSGRWRARRHIEIGQVLRARDVEPVPPIVAKQPIAVRVVSGKVVIDTQGVAEQDGKMGEIIKIRNSGNAEQFMAMVTGEQQVEVRVQ